MDRTTYGVDLAKRVFQMYWLDAQSGEIHNRRFSRGALIEFLAKQSEGTVAMEACGSAHWWARKLQALGHKVVLLNARYIRAFVQRNKTDAADAQAIWTAASQPGVRTVAVKSEEQQAVLGLHRMRALLVKFRTMQLHQLRGLLYEYGVTYRAGRTAGLAEIRTRMAELEHAVPEMLFSALREQLERIAQLDKEIAAIEARFTAWQKHDSACKGLADIPGVGTLTATALVATIGDPKTFKSGREFAAFLGLVPRQSGTGGKVKLLGISKRGDPYVRSLLIHGARAVISRAKDKGAWCEQLLQRRAKNVAVVALANKMARTAWALLARGRTYERGYVSVKPA